MWLASSPGRIRPALFNALKFRQLPSIANHSARRALAGYRNLCRPSIGHDTRYRQAISDQLGEPKTTSAHATRVLQRCGTNRLWTASDCAPQRVESRRLSADLGHTSALVRRSQFKVTRVKMEMLIVLIDHKMGRGRASNCHE